MLRRAASQISCPPKTCKYLTIFQWPEAFDIYSSVYLERASSRKEAITLNRDLLTYKRNRNTLSLHQQNYNWQDLKRHFRREQEVKPVARSTVCQDLLPKYQRPASQSSNFRPSAHKQTFSILQEQILPTQYVTYHPTSQWQIHPSWILCNSPHPWEILRSWGCM